MAELTKIFIQFFIEKEQQFVLLSMERIKEDDTEYLKTLHKEQLIKLRDNIKNICNNIFKIDEELIIICNDIKKIFNVETNNNIKFFKHYLDLNDNLNFYLSMLMKIPLNSIEIYKLYNNSKTYITVEFYKQNKDIASKEKKTSPKAASPKAESPSQIPPPILQARSPPKAASPPKKRLSPPKAASPPKKMLSPSQNIDPKSDKISCYIDILLTTHRYNIFPFFNAIFDYGIYKKQLHMIYKRLFNLQAYIYNIIQYREIIKKVDTIHNSEKITNIMKQKLSLIEGDIGDIGDIDSYYLQMHNNLYNNNVLKQNSNKTCLYNIITQNDKKMYNEELNNFVEYMRYIQDLYIHTLGKIDFINDISRYFATNDDEEFENKGWNANIIDIIKELKGETSKTHEYYYSFFDNYLEEADNQKLINIKIIEKIFSENFLPDSDIEPFKINYENIDYSYQELANYNLTIQNSKNYIHIIQDSNNIYFNIFNSGVLDVKDDNNNILWI